MKNTHTARSNQGLRTKNHWIPVVMFLVGLLLCNPASTLAQAASTPTTPQSTQISTQTTPEPVTSDPLPTPEQMQQEAQKAGYSEAQLLQMGINPNNPAQAMERARELGVPESQIQAYLDQYRGKAEGVQQDASVNTELPDLFGEINTAPIDTTEDQAEIKDLHEDEIQKEKEDQEKLEEEKEAEPDSLMGTGRFTGLQFIGYNTFGAGTEQLGAVSIGPIDPGYLIGKGDILRIYVWGEQQFQYEFTVSDEGNITVPSVGPIFVAGTRYENLENKLKHSLSRYYSTLTTSPPRSFLEVSLTKLRPKSVYLMGEVNDPRTYQISSYATVFNLVYLAGGPTIKGSLRDIRVLRENKIIAHVDLYSSIIEGRDNQDIRLLDNDLVFVPTRGKTVAIDGPVVRPGIYEMKEGENLRDLIQFAGKVTPSTYSFRAQIDRIVPFEQRFKLTDDRRLLDFNLADVMSGKKKVELEDGDRVSLFPFNDNLTQFVTLEGLGVLRPGIYELGDIKRVRDLIIAADSLSGDVYYGKADVRRTQLDGTETFLSIDLMKVMQGDPADNIALWPQDRVRVYAQSEWRRPQEVELFGFVTMPGTYSLAKNQTLYDLLFTYSGLQDSLRYSQTWTDRADLMRLQPDGKMHKIQEFMLEEVWNQTPGSNILLQPGDIVVLYSRDRFQPEPSITLQGHVKRPGIYRYLDGLTIGDLIFLHSGFEDSTYYARTYQKRLDIFRLAEDGRTRRTISLSLNEILAGGEAANELLIPEDVVQVYGKEILEIESRTVTLAGEVNSPGDYRLRENMTLADLLLLGGGFTQDAWLYEAELTRYDLIDLPGDSIAITRRIPLELGELDGRTAEALVRNVIDNSEHLSTFFLKPMDRVTILPNPEFRQPRMVQIKGEVLFPGEYSLQRLNEKVSDLVRRAGGLTDIAHTRGAQLLRNGERINIDFYRLLKKRDHKEDIVLLPDDIIIIPEEPGTVTIEGLVFNPGVYKYTSGKHAKTYIKEAGGILKDAGDKFITYASGRSQKIDFWHNPKVYDGSVITIQPEPPKDEEKKIEPLDMTEVMKETLTLITSALTIIVLATRIN